MKRLVLSFSLALLGSSNASAESLKTALAAAYKHNSTLNAQRAATRAADEALAQAKAGFRPTVNLTGDVSRRVSTTTGLRVGNGTTAISPYGYSVVVDQALFNGFQTINGSRRAEATIKASREQLNSVEQQTLFNAAQAYANVLQSIEILSVRKRNVVFLKEQLRSSQARLDVGEGTRTDVAQSRAQLALSNAQLFSAQADLEVAKGGYFQVIGRVPKNTRWPRVPTHLYPRSLQETITLSTTQHPNVRSALHAVDAQSFFVKMAEGSFLPTIGLRGSASSRYNESGQGSKTDNVQLTLNATVPLYQAGRASSVVRERKETLGQQRILVDQQRDALRNSGVQAWSQLQAAKANLNANIQQVKASKLALAGVIEERNVGQRTQLEVLTAQNTVLDAQVLRIRSKTSQVIAGYALISAVGRLNSRSLALSVRHYNAKDHYVAVKDKWFGLRTPSGR